MWDAEDYNGTEAEIVVVQAVVKPRYKKGGKRVGENTELWSYRGMEILYICKSCYSAP